MKSMFVVAHPDDEVLGAGALIHRLMASPDNSVDIIILNADYEKTRKEMFNDIERSHAILGVNERALYSFKNMDFYNEKQRDIVENIEEEIRQFRPDLVFTHSPDDLHNDHRITSVCAQQAARLYQRKILPETEPHFIRALYFMEVQSSTDWSAKEFTPDTYVEVWPENIEAKIEALKAYRNVVRGVPHPRSPESIRALATLRGTRIGYRYAEAFKTCWRGYL